MTTDLARVTSTVRDDAQHIVVEMGEILRQLSGTTLLVTGAGGFLCSYFLDVVASLNDSGMRPYCRVIALDNFKSGLPERIEHLKRRSDMKFLLHDLSLPFEPDECVHWAIHGASIASPTFYRHFPLETIDANIKGTRHMLELARRGVRSMLFISTSEIYGDPDPRFIPTPEDYKGNVSCTGPRACYDESKRLAETLCTTYHRVYGTPVKIIRPFNVYGPGQRLDDGRIVPDLMSAALRCKPFVLYSDGRATRSFCYVRDAIRGMLHVLFSKADGEAINVGNNAEEISMGTLAERMSEIAAPPRLPIEYRVNHDPQYLTDSPQRRSPDLTKMRSLAPWHPEVSLTEGLRRTLYSYRELMRREIADGTTSGSQYDLD
jgi:dTDP-glucose 4,6-dehydratase/UDP-glucuronate decarboxylase